eukprot:Hpha_TRINITY_DN15322_c2_g17::TRINITY_DN15322_c2_g17_i2::g.91594::m.91594/K03626/EGD2, NACA; nascent polypeptide-associated complex subunit alpha
MATAEDPKKKEVTGDESDSDDAPALEKADGQAAEGDDTQVPKGRSTRSERKSRKAMAKLGLKPVSGCLRVIIKKAKSVVFTIAQPDVYKAPASNLYVILGEAKMEDAAAKREQELVNAMSQAAKAAPAKAEDKEAAAEDEEEVDEEGINPDDIKLVMDQAQTSRAKAVKALRQNNGDIVNTIMALTG